MSNIIVSKKVKNINNSSIKPKTKKSSKNQITDDQIDYTYLRLQSNDIIIELNTSDLIEKANLKKLF